MLSKIEEEIYANLYKKVKVVLTNGQELVGIFDDVLTKEDWDTPTDHYVFSYKGETGIGFLMELEPDNIKSIKLVGETEKTDDWSTF